MSRNSSAAVCLLARTRRSRPGWPTVARLLGLLPNERGRALADLKLVMIEVGELLCRVGRPVTCGLAVDGCAATACAKVEP